MTPARASTAIVAEVNPSAVDRYKQMRAALMEGSDPDKTLLEIVITSQLAVLGHESAFRMHAIRLFEQGVSRERLQQVILAGLGVTFVIPQAARALEWIDDAHRQFCANP